MTTYGSEITRYGLFIFLPVTEFNSLNRWLHPNTQLPHFMQIMYLILSFLLSVSKNFIHFWIVCFLFFFGLKTRKFSKFGCLFKRCSLSAKYGDLRDNVCFWSSSVYQDTLDWRGLRLSKFWRIIFWESPGFSRPYVNKTLLIFSSISSTYQIS